jgi:hypothetical protein
VETLKGHRAQYGARIGKPLAVPAALEQLFRKIDEELAPPPPTKPGV